jgi:hypothetical protein
MVEWKGTCSTKHALLAQLLRERWPELQPRLVHRVYRASYCDPQVREPFIAALALASSLAGST